MIPRSTTRSRVPWVITIAAVLAGLHYGALILASKQEATPTSDHEVKQIDRLLTTTDTTRAPIESPLSEKSERKVQGADREASPGSILVNKKRRALLSNADAVRADQNKLFVHQASLPQRQAREKCLLKQYWPSDDMSHLLTCDRPKNASLVQPTVPTEWFSAYVSNATTCYCLLWSYYSKCEETFRTDGPVNNFKIFLLHNSEGFRSSNLNVFANISPKSKYPMDMMSALHNQIYINVGSDPLENLKFFQSIEPKGKKFMFFETFPNKQQQIRDAMAAEPRIVHVPVFLSNSPGRLPLHQGALDRPDNDVEQFDRREEYDTDTLDDYLLRKGLNHIPIPILFVDVKVHVLKILAGATDTLQRVRLVIFECHGTKKHSVKKDHRSFHYDAQKLLAHHGFLTFLLGKAQMLPFTGDWFSPLIDTLGHAVGPKCVSMRTGDPLVDLFIPRFNILKACQRRTTS